MLRQAVAKKRRGVALVEFAIVGPLFFFLVLGLFTFGIGVFISNEISHMAREGARYASTHGGKYAQERIRGDIEIRNSNDMATVLKRNTVLLDNNKLEVTVSWSAPTSYVPNNYPFYTDTTSSSGPPAQTIIHNNVTVTVRYPWTPLRYLVGPITLSSQATMAMSY